MPWPAARDAGSCADNVSRVPKLTSFSMSASTCAAEIACTADSIWESGTPAFTAVSETCLLREAGNAAASRSITPPNLKTIELRVGSIIEGLVILSGCRVPAPRVANQQHLTLWRQRI